MTSTPAPPVAHPMPQGLHWQPAWLSWVGAVTSALRGLDVHCEPWQVAGYSGYAFAITINQGLCPSGPTCVDWNGLSTGILALGRSTASFVSGDCYTGDFRNERTRAHARAAFEFVERETQAGRPCVVWGLGVPEFGVAYGVDEDDYLCVEGGPTPARLRWDAIDAPGGPYVLAFPTVRQTHPAQDAFAALGRAVHATQRPSNMREGRTQLAALDFWRDELLRGAAVKWSNSYNAQCWAEARRHAEEFAGHLADLLPAASAPLLHAQVAYGQTALKLRDLAELFPWTGRFEAETVSDDDIIKRAVVLLDAARHHEVIASTSLREAWVALHSPPML